MFLLVDVFYYEDYDILDFFCFGEKNLKDYLKFISWLVLYLWKKKRKLRILFVDICIILLYNDFGII